VGIDVVARVAHALDCAPASLFCEEDVGVDVGRVSAPPTCDVPDVTTLRHALARNVRRYASARGLMPPKRLASCVDMSASELYAMLDGDVSVSIDRLAALSVALVVRAHLLLESREGPPLR